MIKLINGDCLDVMDKLIKQEIKVDCIVTDPPYLHVKGGMKSKRINTGSYKASSYVNTEMRDFDEGCIYLFLNKAKKIFNGSFNGYFFCSKLQIVSYLKWTQENKLSYDLLIWDREKHSLISSKFYTSNIDYVVRIYGKGRALNKILNKEGKIDIEYYKKIQSYKQPKKWGHETEKPTELLIKYILLSSNKDDIIFDPYAGSGSTLEACKITNRNCIGIELNKNIFLTAQERLNEPQQQELF